MNNIELNNKNPSNAFNMTSIEETIQLARLQAANSSSLYERKHNQKALKVLTVAAYILFVSMAAIILSFYYVFIWDPTSKTIPPRTTTNCDTNKRIVIPEDIAIQLANRTEVSAEYFYQQLYKRYLQIQKQKQNDRKSLNDGSLPTSLPKTVADIRSRTYKSKKYRIELPIQTGASSKPAPIFSTTNPTYLSQNKDQEAYADDEDDNEYDQTEASGANRIRANDTAIYQLDNGNDSDE